MPGIKHMRNYLFSGSLIPGAIITVDGGATIR